MTPNGKAQVGDIVTFDYDIFLLNGKNVLSSSKDGRFTISVGSPHLIPALNQIVLGMKVGEKKNKIFPANECFGDIDTSKIKEVSKNLTDQSFNVGKVVMLNEDTDAYRIISIDNENNIAVLDANHILSGHCLKIFVEIISIN